MLDESDLVTREDLTSDTESDIKDRLESASDDVVIEETKS